MSFLNVPRADITASPSHRLSKQAGPVSAPSPTPSASFNPSKRKRDTASNVVYSQPANTGMGTEVVTQVVHLIDYLKEKEKSQKEDNKAMSWDDIVNYLSIQAASDAFKNQLLRTIQAGGSIEHDRKGFDGKGSYKFRPRYPVRSAEDLKGYLQRQTHAKGIPVNELREGWPGAAAGIDAMEGRGELLVTRLKKDNAPKAVWLNDPSLRHEMSDEFKKMWFEVSLPANPDELRQKLEAAGLKPTSAPREVTQGLKVKKEKKKVVRRGGKQTNTHMIGLLRDYSHKRK